MGTVALRLTGTQKVRLSSRKRFVAVVAGRRFGKTHLAAVKLFIKAVNDPGSVSWYLAPTFAMAKDVMWPKLKGIIHPGYILAQDQTELTLRLLNGSIIGCRSADNPDRLRGPGLNLVVFDEAAYMVKGVWEVIRPALADTNGEALFISTPSGFNWFYDLVTEARSSPYWDVFEYTTEEGGNVSLEEIENARATMDERIFKQEFLASFESLAGRVYYAFDRKKHASKPLEDNRQLPLLVGLDFNINPMSAVFGIKRGGQIHIIGECEIPSGNTEDMVRYIQRYFPGRKVRVYPDPTGNARKTSAPVGQTDFTILRRAGFQVLAPSHPYPVADKINTVNGAFMNAKGEIRLLIDNQHCPSLCRALEGYTYRPDSSEPDKSLGLDHITDALGYLVLYELPMVSRMRKVSILGV